MSQVLVSLAAAPAAADSRSPTASKGDGANQPAFNNVLANVASRSDGSDAASGSAAPTAADADSPPGRPIAGNDNLDWGSSDHQASRSDAAEDPPKAGGKPSAAPATPDAVLIALAQAAVAAPPPVAAAVQPGSQAAASTSAATVDAPDVSATVATAAGPAGAPSAPAGPPLAGQTRAAAASQDGPAEGAAPTQAGAAPSTQAEPGFSGSAPAPPGRGSEAAGPVPDPVGSQAAAAAAAQAVTPAATPGEAKPQPVAAVTTRPAARPTPAQSPKADASTAAPALDEQAEAATSLGPTPAVTSSPRRQAEGEGSSQDRERTMAPVAASSLGTAADPPAPPASQVAAAINDLAASFSTGRALSPNPSTATAAEARSASPSSAAASASAPAAGQAPSPVREVVIQLNPENLGSVSVRMRMAGDRVDIQIHVANSQTLDLLNKDRHVLSAAVQGIGGSASGLVLAAAPTSADTGPGSFSGGSPGSSQQQAATAGSGEGGAGQRAARSDTPQSSQSPRDEDHASIDTSRPRGPDNSVYL